jgi:hypothetical protein
MKLKDDVAISETGFVFLPTTGESFSVNPIGGEILQLLKQGKSIQEISNELFEKYDADPQTIDKDITDFIEILNHYSLIEE